MKEEIRKYEWMLNNPIQDKKYLEAWNEYALEQLKIIKQKNRKNKLKKLNNYRGE